MTLKQDLGKKIQKLRKEKKITQEHLAELVGIDPKNISKIENGNNYPTAENLTSIAKALQVDIYELFVFNEVPIEQMKNLGYHEGYKYPHDYPENYVEQQYLPDKMLGTKYYTPK